MSAEVKPQQDMTLNFHTDPGHGWLEVPKAFAKLVLRAKYSQISCFSYMHGGMLFLEEDCDVPLFVEACRIEGINVKYETQHKDETPIRQYDGFMV